MSKVMMMIVIGVLTGGAGATTVEPKNCDGLLSPGRLTCALTSGRRTARVSIDLSDPETEGISYDSGEGEKAVVHYDLFYAVEAACAGRDCQAEVTFFSTKAEDEVGQIVVRWTLGARGEIHRERVTGAPDRRKYVFTCAVE